MRAAVVAVALLAGCTVIDMRRPPPEGWPKLQVTVIKTGFAQVQAACGSNAVIGLLAPYFACATVNLSAGTCVIHTMTDDPYVMEHEMEHCAGRDHIGDSTLREYHDRWSRDSE